MSVNGCGVHNGEFDYVECDFFFQGILFILGKGSHPLLSIAEHPPHPTPGPGEATLQETEPRALGGHLPALASPLPALGTVAVQAPARSN